MRVRPTLAIAASAKLSLQGAQQLSTQPAATTQKPLSPREKVGVRVRASLGIAAVEKLSLQGAQQLSTQPAATTQKPLSAR
ncbi:hypothetical protein XAP6164_790004 [Xanthomonas phaseoli pv. phaseoli]|nr:hypothetical protein XAP6164_790004 [Xanthomonas phaseoli pv. phaseoli]